MPYDTDLAEYAKKQAIFWIDKADDCDPDRQDGATCALIAIGHALIALREESDVTSEATAGIWGTVVNRWG